MSKGNRIWDRVNMPFDLLTRGERGFARLLPPFMRAHLHVVLPTFVLILAAGVAIATRVPRPFVASTELWLARGPDSGQSLAPDTPFARATRNTELNLLMSRELATRTVDVLGLDRVPGIGQPHDGSLLNRADAKQAAVRALQDRLRVDVDEKSYAVRIRFKAERPELAASVANRLADLYVDDRNATSATARERQRLAAAVAETGESALRGEAVVEAYRSAIAILGSYERQANTGSELAKLNAELGAARSRASDVHARGTDMISVVVPGLPTPRRPRVQHVIQGTPSFKITNEQESDRQPPLSRAATQTRSAHARVRLLSYMRERSASLAIRDRHVNAELTRLKRVADEAKDRHSQAMAALQREARTEARSRSTAYVISRSSAESAQHKPSFWVLALFTLTLASATAVLTAVVLERNIKGFRSAMDLECALSTKVLATVPELLSSHHRAPAGNRSSIPDYLIQYPTSVFATVFADLATSLRENSMRQGPLTVSISSALADEGKTTVALCLARSAALKGESTVLVDCDIRRPAASRALLPELSVGLVEVIEGRATLTDALQDDPGSGMKVLGISSGQQAHIVALKPNALATIIKQLSIRFDFIVCDTPPALALSEAREAAAMTDAVLLVVRHRVTPKEAVIIAQDSLARTGAQVVGAVLTIVRPI